LQGQQLLRQWAAAAAEDRPVEAKTQAAKKECEIVKQKPSKKKGLNVKIKEEYNKQHEHTQSSKAWQEAQRRREEQFQFEDVLTEPVDNEESSSSSSDDEDAAASHDASASSSRAANGGSTRGQDKLPVSCKQALPTAHAGGAAVGELASPADEEPEAADSYKASILLTDATTELARTSLKDFGARFLRRHFTKLCGKKVCIIAGRPLAHWCRADRFAAAEYNGHESNQGQLRGVVMRVVSNNSATTLVLGLETPPASSTKR
jgi:hypothetical protein